MSTRITVTVRVETTTHGAVERTIEAEKFGDNPAFVREQTLDVLDDVGLDVAQVIEGAFGRQVLPAMGGRVG